MAAAASASSPPSIPRELHPPSAPFSLSRVPGSLGTGTERTRTQLFSQPITHTLQVRPAHKKPQESQPRKQSCPAQPQSRVSSSESLLWGRFSPFVVILGCPSRRALPQERVCWCLPASSSLGAMGKGLFLPGALPPFQVCERTQVSYMLSGCSFLSVGLQETDREEKSRVRTGGQQRPGRSFQARQDKDTPPPGEGYFLGSGPGEFALAPPGAGTFLG